MNKKILNTLAHFKQRLSYASGWTGIIGMPLLIVNLIQEKLKLINININFLILLFLSISGLFLIGYISEKIGLIKAEANWGWRQQEDMQKQLKR